MTLCHGWPCMDQRLGCMSGLSMKEKQKVVAKYVIEKLFWLLFFLSIEAGHWMWFGLSATTVFIIDKTPNKYLKKHFCLGLLKKVNRKVWNT